MFPSYKTNQLICRAKFKVLNVDLEHCIGYLRTVAFLHKMFKRYDVKRSFYIKAADCICSSKYVFLKNSRYSQENICVGVSFW